MTLTPAERAELLLFCEEIIFKANGRNMVWPNAVVVARALKSLLTQAPSDERVEEIRKRVAGINAHHSRMAITPPLDEVTLVRDCEYLLSLRAAAPTRKMIAALPDDHEGIARLTVAGYTPVAAAQAPKVDADATAINGHATVETIAGAYNWLSGGYPAQAQDFLRNALLAAGWKINDKFPWSYQEYPRATPPSPSPTPRIFTGMCEDALDHAMTVAKATPALTKAEVTREEIAILVEDGMHGIEWAAGKRPSVEDLERILKSDNQPRIHILPDGSITAGEPRDAAYKTADTIMALVRDKGAVRP